jgi:nucleoside-diphosphate-sugar epimerase
MPGPAVLLIGASGFIGSAVSQEFLAQKWKFRTVAVLAAPEKINKFKGVKAQGIKIVIGSSTDSSSYKGKH